MVKHPDFQHDLHDASNGGAVTYADRNDANDGHDGSTNYGIYCLSRRSCFCSCYILKLI